MKDLGGFDDKAVEKADILFLFIRPDDESLEGEVIELVEEALVKTCNRVDAHHTYTAGRGREYDSNDDIDNGDNDTDIALS